MKPLKSASDAFIHALTYSELLSYKVLCSSKGISFETGQDTFEEASKTAFPAC